jgi:outer membrane lipoprotein carrier protein
MNIIRFFMIGLLFPALVWAQPTSFGCSGNQALKIAAGRQVMAKVQSRYAELKGFSGEFRQYSYMAALDASESSRGIISYRKPGQMKWDYEYPEKQIFLLADGTFWYYQELDRQLIVDCLPDVLASDVPVAFLLGLGNLEDDFGFENGCYSEDGIVLVLKPSVKDSTDVAMDNMMSLRLLVNRETYLPIGAEVVDLGGNKTTLLLRDLDTQRIPAVEEFSPEFPSGLDINDRRVGQCKK